jgi:hypothetical protein
MRIIQVVRHDPSRSDVSRHVDMPNILKPFCTHPGDLTLFVPAAFNRSTSSSSWRKTSARTGTWSRPDPLTTSMERRKSAMIRCDSTAAMP